MSRTEEDLTNVKAEVERMKRSRTAYKGHMTRNVNKGLELINGEETPILTDIETVIELINKKLDTLSTLDKEISANLDGEESSTKMAVLGQFEGARNFAIQWECSGSASKYFL